MHAVEWLDTDGVAHGFKNVDGQPRIVSQSYLEQIAEGNVAGHVPWTKIGFSATVNTTESDIWSKAGAYTFCTTAGKWEVVSTDNGQDIGTTIKSGTSTGGSTTTLVDASKDFTAATAVAIGDCIILDKSGAVPEWGYVTAITNPTTLTIAGGFSMGGTGASRAYVIVDKSARTGAHAVKIDYLTNTFAEKTEIVILNGTTAVDTINTDLYRVNSFRIVATGDGNKPVGNITLQADGVGATYSYISSGFTRARNTMYTVPVGKTLYVNQWSVGWSTPNDTKVQTARFYTRANIEPSTRFNTGRIFYPYTEAIITNNQLMMVFPVPTKLMAGTDIKVSGLAINPGSGPATTVLRGWIETT